MEASDHDKARGLGGAAAQRGMASRGAAKGVSYSPVMVSVSLGEDDSDDECTGQTMMGKVAESDDMREADGEPKAAEYAMDERMKQRQREGEEEDTALPGSLVHIQGTIGFREWFDRWAMMGAVIGFAAVGGFLFGYDTGVIGGAILLIEEQFNLSSVLVETVISIALVGAIVGSASGGPLSDMLGRRIVMAGASLLFVIGSLIMGVASGVAMLIIGRFIVGLAIGVAAIVSPVYLAEISPARYRGAVVTVNNLCLTGGQFISYLVDSAFVNVSGGWRWMLGLGALPAAIQLIGVAMWLPESPRWLMAKCITASEEGKEIELISMMNDGEESDEIYDEIERMQREREDQAEWQRMHARSILCRLRGGTRQGGYQDMVDEEVEEEMREIESSLQSEQAVSIRDKLRILASPSVRFALFVGLGLQIFQQICGINTAMYYSPTILKMAGFESHESAIWFADIVAFANALFTGVSLLLLDRVGRRTLLLVSLSGVILALVLLGFSFAASASKMGYMAVASLVLYVAFFALGMGPIPWVVNSEIYPASVRGLANGLAATVNWTANLFVSMTFLSYIDLVGTSVVFWTFACVGVVAWLFVFLLLPETKGVPMEQIQQLFETAGTLGKRTTSVHENSTMHEEEAKL